VIYSTFMCFRLAKDCKINRCSNWRNEYCHLQTSQTSLMRSFKTFLNRAVDKVEGRSCSYNNNKFLLTHLTARVFMLSDRQWTFALSEHRWDLAWERLLFSHHGKVVFNHLIKWRTQSYHALITLDFFSLSSPTILSPTFQFCTFYQPNNFQTPH
jgi:hypothetical protein